MGVSGVMVRVLVDAVERAGVARGDLLRSARIDSARLVEADARFDSKEFATLQMRAMDLTRDEALGLHIIERTHDGAFDLISHLVVHAPTLREALGLSLQFHPLVMDDALFTLNETDTTAVLQIHLPRTFERADRMLAELSIAALTRMVRVFGGAGVGPVAVSFEHARPGHHREYARLFGSLVSFSQPTTGLVFDRAVLDRPQLYQHPELYGVLRLQAQRALDRVATELGPVDQLKRYLLARPPARLPDLSTAARDLGMSPRSLRRRLAEDGITYRSVVRGILEDSAGLLLRDPRQTIQQTAHALGFANVGAFHRAFKRWTGMTPMQYRETPRPPRRGGSGDVNR
ncbi:MAG TPA: AraC family transcriptional regulator [Polyangiaceae bacterium]|nr:AraC family transcriptional regulator [Polyangiaceae bacterium]